MSSPVSRSKIVFIETDDLPPELKCSGCLICQSICGLVHAQVANPKRSRIRVQRRETEAGDLFFTPLICQQCDEHPCLDACPSSALVEDEVLGIVRVREEDCSGCEACVDACPHDGIHIDPVAQVALKCDLCGGRPRCVEICPAGVLALVDGTVEPHGS